MWGVLKRAGDFITHAVQQAGSAVETAGQQVGAGVEKAGQQVGDAAQNGVQQVNASHINLVNPMALSTAFAVSQMGRPDMAASLFGFSAPHVGASMLGGSDPGSYNTQGSRLAADPGNQSNVGTGVTSQTMLTPAGMPGASVAALGGMATRLKGDVNRGGGGNGLSTGGR